MYTTNEPSDVINVTGSQSRLSGVNFRSQANIWVPTVQFPLTQLLWNNLNNIKPKLHTCFVYINIRTLFLLAINRQSKLFNINIYFIAIYFNTPTQDFPN